MFSIKYRLLAELVWNNPNSPRPYLRCVVYIWYNPSIFSSNDLESPTVSCSKEDSSPKKCQMKFFCLMDSCHSNFLSNLRLKWGTKNGERIFRSDKIREHRTFCPGAKQPITYLSILLEIQFRLKSTFLKCVIVLTKKKFLFKNRVTNNKFKAILISRNLYL